MLNPSPAPNYAWTHQLSSILYYINIYCNFKSPKTGNIHSAPFAHGVIQPASDHWCLCLGWPWLCFRPLDCAGEEQTQFSSPLLYFTECLHRVQSLHHSTNLFSTTFDSVVISSLPARTWKFEVPGATSWLPGRFRGQTPSREGTTCSWQTPTYWHWPYRLETRLNHRHTPAFSSSLTSPLNSVFAQRIH